MDAGEWFREKIYSSTTGKEEWKYYYVSEILQDGKTAALTVYILNSRGRVLGPRETTGSIDLLEQLTKVSEEYACSVLKIQPPEPLV